MVIKVVVGDLDNVDGVCFYEVTVTNESGQEWRVDKRFNEFRDLDKEIVIDGRLTKKKAELPTTGRFGIRKSLRMSFFMDARKEGLNKYIQSVCAQVSTLEENDVLHRFLRLEVEEYEEAHAEPWRRKSEVLQTLERFMGVSSIDALQEDKKESEKETPAVTKIADEPGSNQEAEEETPAVTKTADEPVSNQDSSADEQPKSLKRSTSLPERRMTQIKPKMHVLSNVYERRCLSAGFLQLFELLVVKPEFDVSEMPRRPNGTLALLQSSNEFLKRLLTDQIKFEGSMKSDIAAAQPDLKRLCLEQLVKIRSCTVDFSTESASHSAHTNFLITLDKNLYEKLARRSLRVGSAKLPDNPEPLMMLGYQATLRLGVAQLLKSGWNDPSRKTEEGYPNGANAPELAHLSAPVPNLWAIRLEKEQWEGCCVDGPCGLAFFHTEDLELQLAPGEPPDLCDVIEDENYVAVVADGSQGRAKERMLTWTVYVLDTMSDTFFSDFAAEMERSCKAQATKAVSSGQSKGFQSELSTAIKKRATLAGDLSTTRRRSSLVAAELAAKLAATSASETTTPGEDQHKGS